MSREYKEEKAKALVHGSRLTLWLNVVFDSAKVVLILCLFYKDFKPLPTDVAAGWVFIAEMESTSDRQLSGII